MPAARKPAAMKAEKLLVEIGYVGRRTPLRPALRAARERVDSLLLALGRPPILAELDGLVVRGFLRHRDFLRRAEQGYERTSMRLFSEALEPGTTVVDGGAHVGMFALAAARRLGRHGRVIAAEADVYNFAALDINRVLNSLDNLTPVHAALDEDAAERTFYVSRGTIASSLVEKTYVPDMRAVRVRTQTIDRLLDGAELDRLVLKLDVEGAEDRVLRGASSSLRRASSVRIVLEHNPEALTDAGVSTSALLDLLASFDLNVAVVDEEADRLAPATTDSVRDFKGNLVADRNLGVGGQGAP